MTGREGHVLKAGFAVADITPPLGAAKIGNLRHHVGRRVADPLLARAAVLDDGASMVALVSLDALSVSRRHVAEIRERLAEEPGLRGDHVLVAATHTHGSGPLVRCGAVPQDAAYREQVTSAVLATVRAAYTEREPAEWASARAVEPHLARNRRVVQRDGTVRTHGALQDPGALWIEGPIDPEVTVLVARAATGRRLGCIVCYACHPTDHGDDDAFSAGFPGVLANELRADGVPVTLFFNGAQGNVHPMDPTRESHMPEMNVVGARLAERVRSALAEAAVSSDIRLGARTRTVRLPFRRPTDAERDGRNPGAQRFAGRGPEPADWPRLYADMVQDFEREAAEEGTQLAEVQCLELGDDMLVTLPAEPFAELGLEIKEAAFPRRVTVVGLANGMVGYVPARAAFRRGGYETTLSTASKLAPEAAELLVRAAVELLASNAVSEPRAGSAR